MGNRNYGLVMLSETPCQRPRDNETVTISHFICLSYTLIHNKKLLKAGLVSTSHLTSKILAGKLNITFEWAFKTHDD